MKIAFTTSGNDLGAPLESRFGRVPRFLVYDMDKDSFSVLDNRRTLHAARGAGIRAAEAIARAGVCALVTGHCGPKAFRVLEAARVRIFTSHAPTVGEALELFRTERLVESLSADVDGHWT